MSTTTEIPKGKIFVPLENNPAVMNRLGHALGLTANYDFYDLLSLTEPVPLSFDGDDSKSPGACHGLLFIKPSTHFDDELTAPQGGTRQTRDLGKAADAPVIFYWQLIRHTCGMMALLHCMANMPLAQKETIAAGSIMQKLLDDTRDLDSHQGGQYIYDSPELDAQYQQVAQLGDSVAPEAELYADGHGFIAYARGRDGHLWELEGGKKIAVDLGPLDEGTSLLSASVMQRGPLGYVAREEGRGRDANMEFSCLALCETRQI